MPMLTVLKRIKHEFMQSELSARIVLCRTVADNVRRYSHRFLIRVCKRLLYIWRSKSN